LVEVVRHAPGVTAPYSLLGLIAEQQGDRVKVRRCRAPRTQGGCRGA